RSLSFVILPLSCSCLSLLRFFFNDTATTEISTLSLHDALPICLDEQRASHRGRRDPVRQGEGRRARGAHHHPIDGPGDQRRSRRSEEHTSELQSLTNLVCRLLLEKKKKNLI